MAAKKKTPKSQILNKFADFKKTFKNSKYSKYIVLITVLILLAGVGYLTRSLFVAAVVNGKPISRISLEKELEKKSGKQTLENLIQKELILQEASKNKVVITDDDVQKEISRLTQSVEAQGVTLDDALAYQGQTRSDLEENIRLQKMLESILAEKLAVSDEDVQKYFEQNKDLYGKDAKLADMKDQISAQLKQDKLSNEFKSWMDKLQGDSKIIYFVNF